MSIFLYPLSLFSILSPFSLLSLSLSLWFTPCNIALFILIHTSTSNNSSVHMHTFEQNSKTTHGLKSAMHIVHVFPTHQTSSVLMLITSPTRMKQENTPYFALIRLYPLSPTPVSNICQTRKCRIPTQLSHCTNLSLQAGPKTIKIPSNFVDSWRNKPAPGCTQTSQKHSRHAKTLLTFHSRV